MHINKLTSLQEECDALKSENEKLKYELDSKVCSCASTSIHLDDYMSLQSEFEDFKKKFYVERMLLQTECSYLRDLFKKLNTNGLDIDVLQFAKECQ